MSNSIVARIRASLRDRFPRDSAPRQAVHRLGRVRKGLRRAWREPLARLLARILPGAVMRDRNFFDLWEKRGFHTLAVHFYSPVPDTRTLPEALWSREPETVGIEWNDSAQLQLVSALERYKPEYEQFPRRRVADPYRFSLENGSFKGLDAPVLYGMVRHFKPRHFVEIGSGHSTLLTAQAVRANEEEGHKTELVAIEPYPDERLRHGFPGLSRVISQPVQEVPLEEFTRLSSGDFLFIDSSHVLKIGSDVQYEFLEILPRLQPGVVIHVHDIFLPAEYPRDWVVDEHRFFNEQYLLQAFLAFNRSFEVLWGSHYMFLKHPAALRAAFPGGVPGQGPDGGGSFWIRRVR